MSTTPKRSGAIEVSAENGAKIHSTVATASISVAIGGTNGISFSGGGAVALNNIATDTNAFIEASTITEADSVSVTAKASSTIKADTLAVSLSLGVGGTVGGAASFGAAVAINEIGHGAADRDQVQAYVRGSSIEATGCAHCRRDLDRDHRRPRGGRIGGDRRRQHGCRHQWRRRRRPQHDCGAHRGLPR